ncbi:Dolichyl-phosphate-mannose-protein mannosyltransferase [Tranquillimonas rosea]|uniref:Dolichyl-phosphate-mannose-protein mannosyltransferase n=1 Tax=Tranquillimonas rosea TaxID=641238 RepID=A0A1H9W2R2_9RHOB|nr:glycosyltransferase family 39 protein [Tranquillimonas rosea]SES27967.1 Dolichyl-phosphate-mannose-protein mannosyltransferase [Tranquillimonas rosea]
MPRSSSATTAAVWIVLAVTAARIVALAFNKTDLFVDETQYWLWGENLDFGYFSKPPLIGWVIRAVTELASDSAFWIRLPACLFHAATALILGRLATELHDSRTGFWVAVGYVTLPFVGLGSLLISTDTIMAPFYAAALLFYFRLLRDGRRRNAWATGVMVGLAFMAKYAGIYFLMTALLAAIALRQMRPRPADAAKILVAFAVVASPNIVWNIANDLTTVSHTMDNAQWVREGHGGLHPGALAEFFLNQFIVFGPVLFGMMIWLVFRPDPAPGPALLWMAWPIVVLVCGQALLSRAYANWAVAAYFAGIVAVMPVLMRHRALLTASFVVNGALCLALPAITMAPGLLTDDTGRPLISRYLGRADMSHQILSRATEARAGAIVSDDRAILADLFHTGRNADMRFFAVPSDGPPAHYYAQEFALPGTFDGLALLVTTQEPPACAERVDVLTTPKGAYSSRSYGAYRIAPACLDALR